MRNFDRLSIATALMLVASPLSAQDAAPAEPAPAEPAPAEPAPGAPAAPGGAAPVAPASRHFSRSPGITLAVRAITGRSA